MNETKLLPCPFCGGKAELKTGKMALYDGIYPVKYELRVGVSIRCTKCYMSEGERTASIDIDHKKIELKQSIYETKTVISMFERWNRRATDERAD